MSNWARGSVLSLLAVVGASLAAPSAPPSALEGKKAPAYKADFTIEGKKPGKLEPNPEPEPRPVVLLNFWATWCPPCRASFPHLSRLHKEYRGKGLEIVGVTKRFGPKDDQKALAAFARDHKLTYRIQSSPDAVTNFNIVAFPTFVLIDRKGVVRMVKVGAGEANLKDLEAKIKALLAGK